MVGAEKIFKFQEAAKNRHVKSADFNSRKISKILQDYVPKQLPNFNKENYQNPALTILQHHLEASANTVVCISLETRIHYLAVVFLFVKIQKLLIYVLKDLNICHKFKH